MLIKRKMTSFGVEAKIWKLGYISLDRFEKYGSITMNLYMTENAEHYIESIVEPILDKNVFDKYFENGGDIFENCERFMLENCEFFKTDDVEMIKAF
nr:MAG TPA: hypothetical protein [Caudoviricetes sp.]